MMKCNCGKELKTEIEKDTCLCVECDKKWGRPQSYGILKIKYIPTGEVKELKLGIRRMSYNNEVIFCDCWGYDRGKVSDLNNPNNYEVIEIKKATSGCDER